MNPIPQKLIDWLTESLNRIFQKQPKYFKYWTWLSYVLMLISGVPYVLTWIGISLPEPFATLSNKFITGVSVAMLLMSKLTVKNPTVGQTAEGSPVHVTDDKKMPFTSKEEDKEVAEAKPPEPVLPQVPDESPKDK